MDKEEEFTATASKRRKIEEEKEEEEIECSIISTVNHDDDSTVDISVGQPVLDLSDHEWLLIFDYLSAADWIRLESVCKRFRELVRTSWKSVTRLNFRLAGSKRFSRQWSGKLLEASLQRCGQRLISLHLYTLRYRTLPSEALLMLGKHCTALEEINFGKMILDKYALQTLGAQLPKLKVLSMNRCYWYREEYVAPFLKILKLPYLLKSPKNRNFYSKSKGVFFSEAPPSLLDVTLEHCHCMTDEGIRLLAHRCQNLQAVTIHDCKKISGQAVGHLIQHCRRLRRFMYSNSGSCWTVATTEQFLNLSNLQYLEDLNVDWEKSVNDDVFKGLGENCRKLQHLSCRQASITNRGLSHLAPCKQLVSIDLSYCSEITDRGLLQLSLAHPELRHVRLVSCGKQFTPEGVDHLLTNRPNLLDLDISQCPHLTDRVLDVIEAKVQSRPPSPTLPPLAVWVGGTVSDVNSARVEEFQKNNCQKIKLYHHIVWCNTVVRVA